MVANFERGALITTITHRANLVPVHEVREQPDRPGMLVVLTGMSGSGKSTVADKLVELNPEMGKVVTTTTREPREGETHGIHYLFTTKSAFVQGLRRHRYLESMQYKGNYYGTQRRDIEQVLEGRDMVWVINMERAVQIQDDLRIAFSDPIQDELGVRPMGDELADRTVVVLVGVPSLLTARARFVGRGGSHQEFWDRTAGGSIDKRTGMLEKGDWQVWRESKDNFPNIVMNRLGEVDVAAGQVADLVETNRLELVEARRVLSVIR